jgi:hypothetical protein
MISFCCFVLSDLLHHSWVEHMQPTTAVVGAESVPLLLCLKRPTFFIHVCICLERAADGSRGDCRARGLRLCFVYTSTRMRALVLVSGSLAVDIALAHVSMATLVKVTT